MRRLLRTFVPLLAIVLVISCGDDSTGPDTDPDPEPTTGTVEVTTSTSGEDQDEDGYIVTLGDNEEDIGTDETVTFEDLDEDSYDAELSGISSNCSVDGDNPRSVEVTAGEIVSTTFEIHCEVVEEEPMISSLTPQEGEVGTEVTIEGSNFSATASENTITFNGTEASVSSAAEDQLVTEVPEGATDGPVEVTVDGETATGPEFDVQESESEAPTISSVEPLEGTVDTEVTIAGSNFSSTNSENKVTFNGTEASVRALEDVIYTEVPEGATDGPIKVEVNGKETTGPDFDVFPAPTISSVSPEEGEVGSEITITGTNFRPTATKNTVTIDDVEAPIKEATSTQIIAEVPEGVEFGYVEVTIGEQTAQGPFFDVLFLGDLEVTTSTSGSDQDYNGYTLTIDISSDNEETVNIGLNETVTIKDLEVDSYSFNLSGVASNCSRSGSTSRVEIEEDQVTTLELDINCQTTGVSSGQGKLVYVSGAGFGDNIKISNIDGSAVDNITNNSDYDSKPVVSPDGEHIAFLSDPDGNGNLFVMDITGENIQKIADNDSDGFEYSWSPDGSELAIIDNNEAYIINRDGSNRRFLADNVSEVDWSPDGSEIALTEVESENVKFVSPDGNEVRSFSIATVSRFDGIDYAPDGSELMVTARTSDEEAKLYFVNTDGSNERLIFRSMNEIYTHPSWSPDGSRFVYQKIRTSPTYSSAMIVADIESGDQSRPHHGSDVSDPFWTPILD